MGARDQRIGATPAGSDRRSSIHSIDVTATGRRRRPMAAEWGISFTVSTKSSSFSAEAASGRRSTRAASTALLLEYIIRSARSWRRTCLCQLYFYSSPLAPALATYSFLLPLMFHGPRNTPAPASNLSIAYSSVVLEEGDNS